MEFLKNDQEEDAPVWKVGRKLYLRYMECFGTLGVVGEDMAKPCRKAVRWLKITKIVTAVGVNLVTLMMIQI